MNMSVKMIDIFCFLVPIGLGLLIFRARNLGTEEVTHGAGPKNISFWFACGGLLLSAIFIFLKAYFSWRMTNNLLVALYGFSFYALLFQFNPYLRLKLKMPWRTSLRLYLLVALIGATVSKLGGEEKSLYFFAACSAIGALAWSRYSIVQTIVTIAQLMTTVVIIFFVHEDKLLWVALVSVLTHIAIFWQGMSLQREIDHDKNN